MLTVFVVLVFIALTLSLVSAAGKVPLWCAVFVLALVELLRLLPLGATR